MQRWLAAGLSTILPACRTRTTWWRKYGDTSTGSRVVFWASGLRFDLASFKAAFQENEA